MTRQFTTRRTSFHSHDLVPETWRCEPAWEQFFVWNPSIIAEGNQYIMVYRVVAPHHASRRLAACRLDQDLVLVPGSVTPLSDTIPTVDLTYGDPRLVKIAGSIYVYFNDFRRTDVLYLVQLNVDSLSAHGTARPMLLDPPRQRIEKNWMLFEHEGELYIEYTITPHVTARAEFGRDDIRCRRIHHVDWDATDFSRRYGMPSGGTPPIRIGDMYFSFFHAWRWSGHVHPTVNRLRAWLQGTIPRWGGEVVAKGTVAASQHSAQRPPPRSAALYRRLRQLYAGRFMKRHYFGGFYAFEAHPPFAPCLFTPRYVMAPEEEEPRQRDYILISRAPHDVVFPGGAVFGPDAQWLVAYGVHDERCCLRTFAHADLLRRCRPVA
jgi:predicted GH43/DUF377 family glycosyl hydrolase